MTHPNTNSKASRHSDTDFLRCAAILLIVNSHLDLYYPIKYVGTGGAIGNALFFMLSSFGLFLSYQKKAVDFEPWYLRRVRRIYPTIWTLLIFLVLPLSVFDESLRDGTFLDWIGYFFFPPSYIWFLRALLLFYIPIYFLIKHFSQRRFVMCSIIWLIVYFCFYFSSLDLSRFSLSQQPFSLLFNFFSMAFGVYLGAISGRIRSSGWTDGCVLIVLVVSIYFHKYLMVLGMLETYQFVQNFLMVPVLYYSLKVARHRYIDKLMSDHSLFSKPIRSISSMTLEIYMVHTVISPTIIGFDLVFPLNILVFLVCTFGLAFGIRKMTQKLGLLTAI